MIVVSIASSILFAASIFGINLLWIVFVTVDRTLLSNISSTHDLRSIVLNQERSKGIFFKETNVIKLRIDRFHDDFRYPRLAVTIVGINQLSRSSGRENDTYEYHWRSDGIYFADDRRLDGFLIRIPATRPMGDLLLVTAAEY